MTHTMYTPAHHIVRTWVRLYTRGLRPDVRDSRRAEVESDLWEEKAWAMSGGSSDAAVARQILARWLLGVPSDLSWRLQKQLEGYSGKLAITGLLRRACRGLGALGAIVVTLERIDRVRGNYQSALDVRRSVSCR